MFHRLILLTFVSIISLFNSTIYAVSETDADSFNHNQELKKLQIMKSSELEDGLHTCCICLDDFEFDHKDHSKEDLVIVCDIKAKNKETFSALDESAGDIELGLKAKTETISDSGNSGINLEAGFAREGNPRHLCHRSCLGDWIATNPECPVCGAKIEFDATYQSVIKNVKGKKIRTRYEWERRVAEEQIVLYSDGENDENEDEDENENMIQQRNSDRIGDYNRNRFSDRQINCCLSMIAIPLYTWLIVYHFLQKDS